MDEVTDSHQRPEKDFTRIAPPPHQVCEGTTPGSAVTQWLNTTYSFPSLSLFQGQRSCPNYLKISPGAGINRNRKLLAVPVYLSKIFLNS